MEVTLLLIVIVELLDLVFLLHVVIYGITISIANTNSNSYSYWVKSQDRSPRGLGT